MTRPPLLAAAALALVAVAGCTTTTPSAAPTPAAQSDPTGPTDAEITLGFCQSVAEKLQRSKLNEAEARLDRAAEAGKITGTITEGLEAARKVTDRAFTASALVEGVNRKKGLDVDVRAAGGILQDKLRALGNVQVEYITDVKPFAAANNAVAEAITAFTAACTASQA